MGNWLFTQQNSDSTRIDLETLRELVLKKGPFKKEPLKMKNIVAHGTMKGLEEKLIAMEKILYNVNEDDLFNKMKYTSALYHICVTMMKEYYMLFNRDPNASVGFSMTLEDVWLPGLVGLQAFQVSITTFRNQPSWINLTSWYEVVEQQRSIVEELKKLPMFAE